MTRRWEVFHPATGVPLLRVRTRLAARLVTRVLRGLDYARTGQGWD